MRVTNGLRERARERRGQGKEEREGETVREGYRGRERGGDRG